jgi:hypothetical protein
MDFALLPEDKKVELAKLMLAPLNSAAEIKDWVKFYLDLLLILSMRLGTFTRPLNIT